MKINKQSWHYKLWRKSFSDKLDIPDDTDLCRYCHRVFWQVIGYAALAGMVLVTVGAALGLLFLIAYHGFWLHTGTALKVIAIGAAVIGLIVLYVRWLKGNRYKRTPKTLVGKYAQASKQKVCPLVEFTSEDDDES